MKIFGKEITTKTSNNEKFSLLQKLAVELSNTTTLSKSVYIGKYNDEYALYLKVNEASIYYQYLGYHIVLKDDDDIKNIMLDSEGQRNLKFLAVTINNHNKQESDFLQKLKEIL